VWLAKSGFPSLFQGKKGPLQGWGSMMNVNNRQEGFLSGDDYSSQRKRLPEMRECLF
jgi:hypothetical protein